MRRTSNRKGFARSVGLGIVVLFVVATFIYFAFRPAIGSPDESRRARHPSGFSMIVPLGWEAIIRINGQNGSFADTIRCLPIKTVGFGGIFTMTRLTAPPDFPKLAARNYKPTTLHGRSAWEAVSERQRTREHSRSLLFEDAGGWYEILLTRPQSEPITGNPWQAYIDSAGSEPAPATQLAP